MTTPNAGSPLRQRMIDDMVARKLAFGTRRGHIFACKQFAAYLGRSPETATPDDVRGFQRHLIDSGRSIHYRNRIMTGVKFLLKVTMRRHDLVAEVYHLREPQAIAVVLAPEEVVQVLACAPSLKARVMLTIGYGCGLRGGEVMRHGERHSDANVVAAGKWLAGVATREDGGAAKYPRRGQQAGVDGSNAGKVVAVLSCEPRDRVPTVSGGGRCAPNSRHRRRTENECHERSSQVERRALVSKPRPCCPVELQIERCLHEVGFAMDATAACSRPHDLGDGWSISTPDAAGLDPDRLRAVVGWLDALDGANVHSILVVRRGSIVFEHYRGTANQPQGPDVRHDLRSVTKVVTGLLVGAALEKGYELSLDAAIFSFFPEYADLRTPVKDRILVRHVLTMSAGLAWDENVAISNPNHGEVRLWHSADRIRTALEPACVTPPGAEWNYSGGSTEILGAILQKATGKPLDELAHELLLDPLDIMDVEWIRHRDASPSASGGLHMRPRDLAKIGLLVANHGAWRGRSLIAADWIREGTSPQIGASDRLFFYGYHWWLGRSLVERKEVTWAAGIGLGGQRLFFVPAYDLVVVMTAGHYEDAMQAWVPLVILNRFILRAVR